MAQEDRDPSAGEGIEKSAGLGRGPLDLREDPAIINCTSPLFDAAIGSCLLNFSGKANIYIYVPQKDSLLRYHTKVGPIPD